MPSNVGNKTVVHDQHEYLTNDVLPKYYQCNPGDKFVSICNILNNIYPNDACDQEFVIPEPDQ